MAPFLTVKEASQLTGKSPSSIRRIIYPIIHDDTHPDRGHVQPTVEEVVQLRMKGENFAWRVSEDFLRNKVPLEATAEKATHHDSKSPSAHGDGQLLSMLRRELDIKNGQITQQSELIAKQMELISGLSERLREGNVLIGSLQQRMALSDGRGPVHVSPPKPKRAPSPQTEKGSTMASKSPKPKKSFLSRLFS